MATEVVRNLGSEKTHIAEVTQTVTAHSFGAIYRQPADHPTRALCGVHITDGVVMRDGTTVRCQPCRYLHGRRGEDED